MHARILQLIWDGHDQEGAQAPPAWRRFLQIMFTVARDLMGGMITLRAMSLVYTTLLSIVPLLAVSIAVLKGFGVHNLLQPTLVGLLAPLGERSEEISRRIVGFVENMQFGVLGAVGLVLLLYTVVSLILKVESAFNHTWRLHGRRNLLQRLGNYLSVVMVGPLLVFSAVTVTALLGNNQIVAMLNALPYMNDLLRFGSKLLPFLLVILAFTIIYLLVPNTRVRLASAFYGALIAGVMWQTAGILFTSFVATSTTYTAIYSSLAILLLFMVWLYISWIILLIGASICYYHQYPQRLGWRGHDWQPSARQREMLAMQAMLDVARIYDRQLETTPTLENLAARQQIPPQELEPLLDAMQADGLLQQVATEPHHYLPGASLKRIRLLDVLHSVRAGGEGGEQRELEFDPQLVALQQQGERLLEAELGAQTLADLLSTGDSENQHEDSLV